MSVSHDIGLITNAVAEAPTLEGTPTDVSGDEGGLISLDIELHTHDSDDVITSITITGVPSDAALTAGHENSDGSWSLTQDDLTGLQLVLGEEGETTLHVVATAQEGGNAASEILGFEDAPVAETGGLGPEWTSIGHTSVQTAWDGFAATEGTQFAVLDSSDQSEGAVETFLGLGAGSLTDLQFTTPAPSLVTDGSAMQTTLSVHAGDELSFNWNFDGNDYVNESGTFNDFAFVTINGQITLLDDTVNEENVPNGGDFHPSGWQTFTYTATDTGPLTLGFGDFNGTDQELNSQLLIDNVRVVTPSGGTATASVNIELTTNPVAEPANLGDTPTDISVNEDGTVSLGIVVQTQDDDDTIVSITITGVPSDATLSAGSHNVSDGTWTLTPEQLSGLTLTAGEEGTADLHVVAYTTEAGLPPVTSGTDINLTVNPVAEFASLDDTQTEVTVTETATVSLDIVVTPHDGDDTVTITITGVPTDATLSNGTQNGDGSWTLTPDQLSGLSLSAADQGHATLHVVASSSEGGLDPVTTSTDIDVTINGLTSTTPSIEGTPQEGQTLTATGAETNGPGEISLPVAERRDPDLRCNQARSYTVSEGDEGSHISVVATVTDIFDHTVSHESDPTDTVFDAYPTITTPVITGTAEEGFTLTASASSSQEDNDVTYQWQLDGIDISGATGSTYAVTEGDEGHTIDVMATATNDDGIVTIATSDPTNRVLDALPTITTPVISAREARKV